MSRAIRLSLLGWTQTEIGDVFKLKQNTIHDIIENIETDIFDIYAEYNKGIKTLDRKNEY